jgi:hypothetical protein
MTYARLQPATQTSFESIRPPFSNFQFVDSLVPGDGKPDAVRRFFSLARRDNEGKTLILEDISPAGAVEDEITELSILYPAYYCTGLKRLTFWSRSCASTADMAHLTNDDLLGYAILKQDTAPTFKPKWHIFESVFKNISHHNNCIPGESAFDVRCGNEEYRLKGIMYCQQNKLNKACAQVALRSLLSRILPDQDIFYREINQVAEANREVKQGDPDDFDPGKGLDSGQIRAVLDSYGVKYDDFDYIEENSSDTVPAYSRILYSGIENGLGGLLGFEFSGVGAKGEKHIIPFYGHTFNQDIWVPRASLAYFHIGDNTRYISSEEWLSSFIGHDDNFGSNYCVPRRFLEPEQVTFVVALRPPNTAYGSIEAEAIGADSLYSMLNSIDNRDNYWVRRLLTHIGKQDVVLRTLYVRRGQYVAHLRETRDWEENSEREEVLDIFAVHLPENLWMVEISIPELFPANFHKLGEVILDACVSLEPYPSWESLWVLSRFPGSYLINPGSEPFTSLDSALESHTPLYGTLNQNG